VGLCRGNREPYCINSDGLVGPSRRSYTINCILFFNLGGIDTTGTTFVRSYSVQAGQVGSLWIGVAIPESAPDGLYSGIVRLGASGTPPTAVVARLNVTIVGPPVPEGGAGNVSSFARLAWLDSTVGLEDSVPAPFSPVGSVAGGGGQLLVSALNKVVTIGVDGLPMIINVTAPKVRRGRAVNVSRVLLASPVTFTLFGEGDVPFPLTVTSPTTVTALSNTSVAWSAVSKIENNGEALLSTVHSILRRVCCLPCVAFLFLLQMSSLCADMTFTATISAPESTPLLLTDVQLCVPVSQLVLKFMVGMGAPGRNYSDLQWRWTNTTASNKLWLGRADAGILVDLKGDGAAWDSPLFGVDFPVIPFVPPTWGGVEALPEGNPYGMNVTDGMFVAFRGRERSRRVLLSPFALTSC